MEFSILNLSFKTAYEVLYMEHRNPELKNQIKHFDVISQANSWMHTED